MKMNAIELHKKKVIISVISGLLCFLLSPYGIQITLDAITLDLPWSTFFPILISIVYGWKYGLIAGLSGGALFPFYLWFHNGYPNLTSTIIYLNFYFLLGIAGDQKIIKIIKNLNLRLLIVYIIAVLIFKIYYANIFNYLLSLNPPFWSNKSINYLSPEILNAFFIKDSIYCLAFIFISNTLIKVVFVRKFFGLNISTEMNNNGKILLYSIVLALLAWSSYFLLGNALLYGEKALKQEHLQLSLFVILTTGLIIAKIMIHYSETLNKSRFELIAAKEEAEESDRLKTAFLQNVSHEIRTPMNAIMGFSSLLPVYFDNKEKLEDFSIIINQRCSDLLDIITDILDISKIESGQITVSIEECNINELFSELSLFFRDYQNRTNKQDIDLFLQPLHDESFATIKTEKVKLKQILVNLISNAFKFTETGYIHCGCEIENNKLKFYVSDTGVGIPKEKFDFIFERFAQLNNSSSQNTGGTGLGLSIAKGLVGLLGGQVWLESECDKGTTFFFTIDYIPCVVSQKPHFNGVKSNDGIYINKTILIVEDDLFNAKYLNEILQKHVANICTVNNGADAIEFVKNNTADVILIDVRLPDITGYEATKEILKHNPDIIIIAQTAYAAHDERQKALSNGCVDYISKPTKQEQLLTVLRKHL